MTGYLRLLISLSAMTLSFGVTRAQGHGQEALPDTAISRLAFMNTIAVYHHFMGPESRLNNGIEHIGYLPMNGHAFFETQTAQTGSIVYEGIWYPDVPILYDIIRDELVVPSPSGELFVVAPEKVKEFYLPGHHFINASPGYYDLLCTGTITLLAKRSKKILESLEGSEIVRSIEYHDNYYVEKDGVRHSIGNLRSLLSLMKDKKKEITQDLKKKSIRYKKQPEQALVEATQYYNQSIHQ
jgi:hypothetical protein